MRSHILLSLLVLTCATANAATVLIDEDFNEDYSKSFPYMFDGDALEPHSSIANIFYSNATGTTMPWWICKDTNESTDRFIASHSYYRKAGKSNDWLISKPLEIDSEGYVLEFDAQCVNVRGTAFISDMALYVTYDLLDPESIPTEPTFVWENVPYGDDVDMCEGDWTHFTYSLDAYAGKTIYVNFVNQNEDRDILCLDNVKVWRHDPVDLTLDYEQYCAEASAVVTASFSVVEPEGIDGWHASLTVGGEEIGQWAGGALPCGAVETFECEVPLTLGATTPFDIRLTAEGAPGIVVHGNATGMAFVPVHRVMFEETTSVHCGNCTMGFYTTESLVDDEEIGAYVIPVSVHLAALGFDPMATKSYYSNLPESNAAPVLWIERTPKADGLNPTHDAVYDTENPFSFAHRVKERVNSHTPIGVEIDADWVIEGNDTVAVNCTATVKAAYDLKDVDFRVAFILTENNVGLDNNAYWIQENYLAGAPYSSRCGGWCDLPAHVINARYHDVARAISRFDGHAKSLPSAFEVDKEYTYSYKMDIPKTSADNNGVHLSDPIQRQMCEVTAIVINGATGEVVNAARMPMSDAATKRFSAYDLLEKLGAVTDITADNDASAEYYDLMGRRVASPQKGVFIRRTASGAKAVIK